MAEGEITVRELRGASEDSTVQIWRDHSQEHPTLWLPRYSFSSALDLSRGSGFFLSLLRWPGCHEAVSCFGALLLLTHLPQHYNSPCPCPPLSHWANSRVSCKPQESPASSKDVTSCSNIWMSSPSLILLQALYVYRIAF